MPLSSDQIEAIHEASLDILDSIGIMFLNDEALDILASAGCDVDRSTKIVKMDRQWVPQIRKHALVPLRHGARRGLERARPHD